MATADIRPLTKPLIRIVAAPAAAVLIGLVGLLYQSTALALARRWNTEPIYLFGFLIPALSLLSAAAVWRRGGGPLGEQVAATDVRRGTFFMLIGCTAHLAALFVNSLPLDVLGLVLVLRGAVQVFGGNAVHRYDPAILLLLFLLPVPLEFIPAPTATLQAWVAVGAARVLDVAGVPAYCDGTVVQLSDFALVAGPASSGLRELEGVSALCLAAALIGGGGRLRYATFIVLNLPIALAVNIGRIVVAGLAYHEQGRPAAERMLQIYEGWLPVGVAAGLVVIAVLVMYAVSTLGRRSTKETT